MKQPLNELVLILNKYFLATQIGVAREAITALVAGRVHVVDEEYKQYNFTDWVEYSNDAENDPLISAQYAGYIHSPSVSILIPQVVRSADCEFVPPVLSSVRYSRKHIYERDQYMCQYCHKKFYKPDLTLDHIIPQCRGGESSWTNLVTACKTCNNRKGSKSLEELGWKLDRKPFQPRWRSHTNKAFGEIQKKYWGTFTK